MKVKCKIDVSQLSPFTVINKIGPGQIIKNYFESRLMAFRFSRSIMVSVLFSFFFLLAQCYRRAAQNKTSERH